MAKILVIEDEESVRGNILRLLTFEDFDVVGAENGAVGFQLAKEQQPDLIICDVMMPELDGYGVLNALRQDIITATIPFIFLTAKAAKEDLRQGMELGANDYLNKPFTRDELLKAVRTQLEKQEKYKTQSEEKLAKLRSSITLSLPHELRTPLNGIIGFSEMLMLDAESLSPAEVMEMAETINTSAQRLDYLIQNFLLYAELEIIASDPEKINNLRNNYTDFAATVITEVVQEKANNLGRKTDLFLDLKETPVNISETDMRKIVAELVDNAFKYSPAATPVRIANTVSGNYFILEITNQGRGMTAEQIKNTGAFMQFDRKVYAHEGSGLGLIICKQLAELHRGELTIESVPNEKTTVRVSLPI